ncbi:MAG: thioredoxin domain-containing protein [Proteobacteria bacterium]|nr:thioredoxin domain-containing protein [Pseudomonadota bacterium]
MRGVFSGLFLLFICTFNAYAQPKEQPGQPNIPDFMPFYFAHGYFNWNGMLSLTQTDIVEGDVFTFPKVAVFFYADLGDPVTKTFFNKQYKTVETAVNNQQAIFILRDKGQSANSVTVYKTAQCLPNSNSIPFVRSMLDVQDQWREKGDIRQWLTPQAAKFGMNKTALDACLKDQTTDKQIAEHAAKARDMKLFRLARPELYVNQYYFPVIVEEDFFGNALGAAIRKLSQSDAPLQLSAAELTPNKQFARGLGSPDAPVTLIQYETPESHTIIPFFKDILPKLKDKYISKGLLRYELRPFPWFSNGYEVLGLLYCLPEEDFFKGYFTMASINNVWLDPNEDWKANPEMWSLTLRQLGSLGIATREAATCARKPDVSKYIKESRDKLMNGHNVFFTPTAFINGQEASGGLVLDAWYGLIDKALAASAAQKGDAQ